MRLIHTADWHIGQQFFGYDRRTEHQAFFEWLKRQLQEQEADVLLVAGDVFDSPNPSAESQKMYYRFLREVTAVNPALQIVIIAGNHDSAARLEAPNPLLEEMRISVKGVVKRTPEGTIDFRDLLIPLKQGEETKAWCMAVPYLRQGDYPEAESYGAGIAAMYAALKEEADKLRTPEQAVIAMGHLQASGSDLSADDRSERIIIGGLEAVPPEIFDAGIAYTALGHLHKAQRVSGQDWVRYSGSPLPMSFAEKNYKQGVNLIELEGNRLVAIKRLAFEPPVRLLSLPDEPLPLAEVLAVLEELPDGTPAEDSPYLEVKVRVTEPEPSLRYQVEQLLAGKAVRLGPMREFRPGVQREERVVTLEDLQTISPLELAEDVFRQRYQTGLPEHLKKLLTRVIQETEL